jgi:hypothetical protein
MADRRSMPDRKRYPDLADLTGRHDGERGVMLPEEISDRPDEALIQKTLKHADEWIDDLPGDYYTPGVVQPPPDWDYEHFGPYTEVAPGRTHGEGRGLRHDQREELRRIAEERIRGTKWQQDGDDITTARLEPMTRQRQEAIAENAGRMERLDAQLTAKTFELQPHLRNVPEATLKAATNRVVARLREEGRDVTRYAVQEYEDFIQDIADEVTFGTDDGGGYE